MYSSKGRAGPGSPIAVAVALAAAVAGLAANRLDAQSAVPPAVVPQVVLARLAGEWFEVAGTGSWARRRCAADTRFRFATRRDPRSLDVAMACTTPRGVERKRGRLRGDGAGSGALRLRLVPGVFSLLPAVWSDFWVLAVGEGERWLLVGDRRRQSLSVLSRTVALDEAAFARALAMSRALSYDIDAVSRVIHPAGATGLRP